MSSDFVHMAKDDIRNRVSEMVRRSNKAIVKRNLCLSDGELEQILAGNGDIALSTFAKVLVGNDLVLRVEHVSATPFGSFEALAQQPPMGVGVRMPRPYTQVELNSGSPYYEEFEDEEDLDDEDDFEDYDEDIEDSFEDDDEVEQDDSMVEHAVRPWERQPRESNGRFARRTPSVDEAPKSPFGEMSREKLEEVICSHLWDSEIDVDNAPTEDLVKFLEEKDKRMKSYKDRLRIKKLEEDPNVVAFKKRVSETVKNNPHLKEWLSAVIN